MYTHRLVLMHSMSAYHIHLHLWEKDLSVVRKRNYMMEGCECEGVCAVCTFSQFVNVQFSACLPLFASQEPGATGECRECKLAMSDGDSLPEKQCKGERSLPLLYRYCTHH